MKCLLVICIYNNVVSSNSVNMFIPLQSTQLSLSPIIATRITANESTDVDTFKDGIYFNLDQREAICLHTFFFLKEDIF